MAFVSGVGAGSVVLSIEGFLVVFWVGTLDDLVLVGWGFECLSPGLVTLLTLHRIVVEIVDLLVPAVGKTLVFF
jgi:hypothetical protein